MEELLNVGKLLKFAAVTHFKRELIIQFAKTTVKTFQVGIMETAAFWLYVSRHINLQTKNKETIRAVI